MSFFIKRKEPNQVFTPRNKSVNEKMYISRPDLEESLKRKLRETKHILIHGESGSGKTWLYKKVLSDLKMEWIPINLASAEICGSITKVFSDTLVRQETVQKTGYNEKIGAEANAGFAKGILDHTNLYVYQQKEPIEACLEMLYKNSDKKASCIVLDNLESIYDNDVIMKELGSIITLIDDDNYAKFNVKFIIVGVPSGVVQYFSKVPNLNTIKNRLSELDEVRTLDSNQTKQFIKIGLCDELNIQFTDELLFNDYVKHIFWVTNGVPQSLHEYCLELSYLCVENDYKPKLEFLSKADKKWLKESFSSIYSVIENMMNSRDTKVGRRNQVLYCIGKINKNAFRTSEVEEILIREFPNSAKNTAMNIGQTLSSIATDYKTSFLKKTAKGDSWFITNNQFVLCIRLMLKKIEDDKVDKINYMEL